jgi:hypothetical protein
MKPSGFLFMPPGIGRMIGYAYSLHANTFETNGEMAS